MAQRQKLIVEWTRTAEIQFIGILEYWTKRNKSTSYAKKLTAQVWDKIEIIQGHPLSSTKTDDFESRRVSLGHFSILYQILEKKIVITAFWDNRQDPAKLYEILKKGKTNPNTK